MVLQTLKEFGSPNMSTLRETLTPRLLMAGQCNR